jgi:hypothetical protein
LQNYVDLLITFSSYFWNNIAELLGEMYYGIISQINWLFQFTLKSDESTLRRAEY